MKRFILKASLIILVFAVSPTIVSFIAYEIEASRCKIEPSPEPDRSQWADNLT